jgi:hypothetical protein
MVLHNLRMRTTDDLLTYAGELAESLRADMAWQDSEHHGGYWLATDRSLAPRIAARATAALEFFRQYAGADSNWTLRAHAVYESKGDHQSAETGARAIGDLLMAWVGQVEAGIVEVAGSRARGEVSVVSTDVMTQVRRLLEDRQVHPAAPIVLCGAALEVTLRAVVDARGLTLTKQPSISVLTQLLRSAGLLTKQDVKDLEQCGGLRNSAAHGEFGELSPERAGLMEQQTNILLRRLTGLQEGL